MSLSKELMVYIRSKILPLYEVLDKGHNKNHIRNVIERSLKLASIYGADQNLVYVIAAFHDLGMLYDRDTHEIISAELLNKDKFLKGIFGNDKIELMGMAIREHRASYRGTYHSIYGKIIAQADRNFDVEIITSRSIQYGLVNFPEYTLEQHFERTYDYVVRKYGECGYVKIVLEYAEDEEKLTSVKRVISSRVLYKEVFCRCYKNIVMGSQDGLVGQVDSQRLD